MRLVALTFAACLLSTPALAESPFDGTWKADLSSLAVTAKPDKYLLKGGTYTCSTCTPPLTVKADGAFHAVKGRDYWDEIAIKEVDAQTVTRQFKLNGKVVAEGTSTVSPDGLTLTSTYSNTNNAAGIKEGGTSSTTRVGAKVPGAHLISGEWKAAPPKTASESEMTVSLKVENGMVHMTSPRNETLHAKIGGDYAPIVGDPGKTMTKVAMPAPRTLAMTDMRGGKVVQTSTYTVSPDGTTLTGKWKDPQSGAAGQFTAKQM